ncbi:hypothetical protein [Streptosporangium sp. NPDC002524]|uniref:hypothetical protein n=1 Tax=Streptosporangium sp. NPDC002524 TaxID=3154537 RepID=UPI003325FE42
MPENPPPRFNNVSDAAAWARYLLVANSPRAEKMIRHRQAEAQRRAVGRDADPLRWQKADAAAQASIESQRLLSESGVPPVEETVDDAEQQRRLSLARARTRARMERANRTSEPE